MPKMNVNLYVIEDYENEPSSGPKKTNPNKPNFKPDGSSAEAAHGLARSADVRSSSTKSAKAGGYKHLQGGKLSSKRERMALSDTDKNKTRLAGLEPATFGSVDRRSIQLSYRRFNV